MTPADLARIRQWVRGVQNADRAATIEQCVEQTERLLAHIDELERAR